MPKSFGQLENSNIPEVDEALPTIELWKKQLTGFIMHDPHQILDGFNWNPWLEPPKLHSFNKFHTSIKKYKLDCDCFHTFIGKMDVLYIECSYLF